MSSSLRPPSAPHGRWFYSLASLSLLVLMFIGFQLFYLQGQSYPGRPITPPIRTWVILHGCLMTVWMLMAVVQPLLVGLRYKRLHMKLGVLGVGLAVGIIVSGVHLGIESARVSPPEMRLFGLAPNEFMAVPVVGILIFGLFVLIGLVNRRRPEVHRPMMLMASLSVMGAALGRIGPLNDLYAGTWWEVMFSALFMQVILTVLLFAVHCVVSKSVDRWFAAGVAAMTLTSVAISQGAKTPAWDQVAVFLLR